MSTESDLAASLLALSAERRPEGCFGTLTDVSIAGHSSGWQVTVDVPELSGLVVQRRLWGSPFIASVTALGDTLVGRIVMVRFVVGSKGVRQAVIEYLVGD